MTNQSWQLRVVEYDETEIAELILRYLATHPAAMDTMEGIAEWWLPSAHVGAESQRVARALEKLIKNGLVTEIKQANIRFYELRYDSPLSLAQSLVKRTTEMDKTEHGQMAYGRRLT